MKNALLICLFISLFFSSSLFAQSIIEKYEKETIYLSGNKYIKNGEKYPLGLLYGKLEKEMEVSPAAQLEWGKYKKSRNGFLATYGVGAAALVAGILIHEENEDVSNVLVGSGAAAVLVSLPLSLNMQKRAQKAIWLRNRDVLK